MNGYNNNSSNYGRHAPMNAMMWDGMQDKQMVASYNAMLQRAADFYNSLESSDVTTPSSGSSSPGPPSRRTSNVIAELKNSIPDKIERRREQNRQSQRAYRDRKEKHQRDLEGQIAQWKDKHRKLSDSYSAQNGEIQRLKSQIDDLNTQIMSLQTGMPLMWGSIAESPSEFDLVPFYGSRTRDSVG